MGSGIRIMIGLSGQSFHRSRYLELGIGVGGNVGFSLLELVAALFIVAIVSAIVVSRFTFTDTDRTAQTDIIKTHLRYTQSQAMGTGSVWYLRFFNSSPDSYAVYQYGNPSVQDPEPRQLPGMDSPTATFPEGTTVNAGASNVISFDSRGVPCTDSSGQTPQSENRTITLSQGGDAATITIIKNTGFIP
jgi:prepilin-type N-terminal cleavage/methylation domain-containing protein